MLRKDLETAGIDSIDDTGRRVDFHSLRHTTASLLAASSVHPRVAQNIMRHSSVELTLGTYTHVYREQESNAVAKLPDLSIPPSTETGRATGTDDLTSSQAAAHLQRAGTPKEQKVSSPDMGPPGKERKAAGDNAERNILKTQSLSTQRQHLPTTVKPLPKEGLEPSRPYGQGILSPQRLPIPPLGHLVVRWGILLGAGKNVKASSSGLS